MEKEMPDSVKVNLYNKISRDVGTPEDRIKYAEMALALGEKIKYSYGLMWAHSNIGAYYQAYKEDLATAIDHYKKSVVIAESLHSTRDILEMYGQLFNIQIYIGNYPAALQVELKGLAIAEKTGDKMLIANFYGNIGFIYSSQNNLPKAAEYLQKFKTVAEELNNGQMLAFVLNNLAGIQMESRQFDSALVNLFSALNIYRKQDKLITAKNPNQAFAKERMAAIYNTISFTYRKLGKNKESLLYADSALNLCRIVMGGKKWNEGSSGINLYDLSQYYLNYGEALAKNGERAQAEKALSEGMRIAEHIKHAEDMKAAYLSLSEFYSEGKNMDKAYAYHVKYSNLKDSILNEKNSRLVSEMNAIYETEKKNKELLEAQHEMTRQQAENRQRATERNAFIAGFLIMAVLAFFHFPQLPAKEKSQPDHPGTKERSGNTKTFGRR